MIKKIIFIFLLAINALCAGNIILYEPPGPAHPADDDFPYLVEFLREEGHAVVWLTYIPDLTEYDVFYGFFADTLDHREVSKIQNLVFTGGRAILCCDHGVVRWNNFLNGVLADSVWDMALGQIRSANDQHTEFPPFYLYGPLRITRFYNFDRSSPFTQDVDSMADPLGSSVTINEPDSGAGKPLVWGRVNCISWAYDSFAVLGVHARYGDGEVVVLGNYFSTVAFYATPSDTDTVFRELELYDNGQFFRNLFTTNDRADSVWLSGTDSTFTVFLPHCTPFVAGSTSFSFESTAYGLWELRASDWSYWHNDSSITIQYPDTCPMGETFEVCVNLVPDATGETVLPCGPVCDSFTFYYTGIAETPTPQSFSISAHPNPFNSAVTITAPAGAEIEVFDVNGRRISVIPDPDRESRGAAKNLDSRFHGNDNIVGSKWQPDPSLGSGIYLLRAKVGNESISKRIVYLK